MFNSDAYKELLKREVEVEGIRSGVKYFTDKRDITLAFTLDGFCPHDNHSTTCWPLILFNLNLPPDVRIHTEELLSLGLVPGPRKAKDFDLFLFPMVEELMELSIGIRTWDAETGSFFYFESSPSFCFWRHASCVNVYEHERY